MRAGRTTPPDVSTVRASLDDACFVAEQVVIAPLQPQHLLNCGSESGELDHGFHEFAVLRAAEAGEANGEAARMTVVELVQRFREVAGRWDPVRSAYGRSQGRSGRRRPRGRRGFQARVPLPELTE